MQECNSVKSMCNPTNRQQDRRETVGTFVVDVSDSCRPIILELALKNGFQSLKLERELHDVSHVSLVSAPSHSSVAALRVAASSLQMWIKNVSRDHLPLLRFLRSLSGGFSGHRGSAQTSPLVQRQPSKTACLITKFKPKTSVTKATHYRHCVAHESEEWLHDPRGSRSHGDKRLRWNTWNATKGQQKQTNLL